MPVTNFPNGFSNGVTIRGIPILDMHSKDVYWVDSNNGADTGKGTFQKPFATVAYANTMCSTARGDMIIAKAGHAETLSTALSLYPGVTLVGLGNGDNRPVFTVDSAIYGLNFTSDDVHVHNIIVKAGSSVTAATRLVRVAASDIVISGSRFEMAYDMYHLAVTISGDNIQFLSCYFENSVTTSANAHPQTCILNTLATNVYVKDCRFMDTTSLKAERWRACVEGGGLTSKMVVEDCTFICRGIATRTRTAGASDGTGGGAPTMATIFCRAISPSANTAVGSLYTPTYQYIMESYNVAAINKQNLLAASTSDKRFKENIVYI